ncbi:hypothetical protein [Rhizobium sp. SSA_523]|uniref:hypothetical protein n=1 Tax=Rhizobium sp. SSA_523 TaxID=2952477 RepID=UPI002090887C|nr:hypothetical protein [Rhizobium sp. SSA_523]MCO5734101.1 hypothetical protein [Rhizobium sp. SSA_523]WKC24739.1 hypothetical protein QTJ18_11980 [Rhizobium sp. SSA_523]
MIPALCAAPVDCFRPDGSLLDLARPMVEEVDFVSVAGTLSRLARFNGTPNAVAFSVAQHCVMGAEALLAEGHDEITAALFLLHDAHEHFIGDKTRPFQALLTEGLADRAGSKAAAALRALFHDIKSRWDLAIYTAAGLPTPDLWTNRQKAAVSLMDERMVLAESRSLFGPQALSNISRSIAAHRSPPLKLRGSLKPWGAMKAEDAYLTLLTTLIGQERITSQRAVHAAHVATFPRSTRT